MLLRSKVALLASVGALVAGFSTTLAHARRARPPAPVTWQNLSFQGGCGMSAFLIPVQLAAVQDQVAACLQPGATASVRLVLRGSTASGLTIEPAAVSACMTTALQGVRWPASSGGACNVSFRARRNP